MSRITRMIRELTFRTNRHPVRMYPRMSRGTDIPDEPTPGGDVPPDDPNTPDQPGKPGCRRPDSSGGLSCCSQQWVQS